jgi:hypothetical protein
LKLSIIIVGTNELHFLRPCLRSVFAETKGIDFEVLVVDNASTDGSREALGAEFPDVKVIVNQEKRGFAAANNPAIRLARGDYLLLLNPDTEVLDGAIQKTIAFMDEHDEVGIAGCKLVYPDGSVQPSVRPFPSVAGTLLEATFLYLVIPSKKVVRRNGIPNFDFSKAQRVDWVIGAYFTIRRRVVEKLGPLDEQFWIYGEEVDYCQRAKDIGFETWYVPDAVVIHHYRGMIASRRSIVWLHYGLKLYVDKHYRGVEKFLIIYIRYFGSLVRFIGYVMFGCISLNRRLIAKGYYYGVALFKMMRRRWRYDHNHVGEVIPWTQYL